MLDTLLTLVSVLAELVGYYVILKWTFNNIKKDKQRLKELRSEYKKINEEN